MEINPVYIAFAAPGIVFAMWIVAAFISGLKNKKEIKYAKKTYTGKCTGRVIDLYDKRVKQRQKDESINAGMQKYAIVEFTRGYETYRLEAVAWKLNKDDMVKVMFNPYNPSEAMLERDYDDKAKMGPLGYILGIIKMIFIFVAIMSAFIFVVDREAFFEIVKLIGTLFIEK